MASINPYLNFNGKTEEAFNFYKSVFGGEFQSLVRFKDMPIEGHPMPDHMANQVMHVSLPIGNNDFLMGSDGAEDSGPSAGTSISVSIHTDNKDEATKLFNGLSAGGNVTMPLADAPWGAFFGMFIDKFGISWMVNCDNRQQ